MTFCWLDDRGSIPDGRTDLSLSCHALTDPLTVSEVQRTRDVKLHLTALYSPTLCGLLAQENSPYFRQIEPVHKVNRTLNGMDDQDSIPG